MVKKPMVGGLMLLLLILPIVGTSIQAKQPSAPQPFAFSLSVQKIQEKAGEYKVEIFVKDTLTDKQVCLLELQHWRSKDAHLVCSDNPPNYSFIVDLQLSRNAKKVSYHFSARLKDTLLQEEKGTISIM